MWLAMMSLALAQPAADPRLDLFVQACVPHRQDLVRAAAALEAGGWVRVDETDHPELASSLGTARRELLSDPEFQPAMAYSFWRRELDGRPVHVVLNRLDLVLRAEDEDLDGDGEIQSWEKADTLTFLGCGLWDFEAVSAVPDAAVTAWAGAGPVQSVVSPGGMSGGTWNVHQRLPGTGEIHVGWIPDGPDADRLGFTGVAISMTSAPEEDADAD